MKDIFTTICIQFRSRFTPKEKFRFLSWVMMHCEKLGYPITVMNHKSFAEKTVHVAVGDLETAHAIVLAGYDTPAACIFPYKYYPLNIKKNQTIQVANHLVHIVISLLFVLLGLWLVVRLKGLDGIMQKCSLMVVVLFFLFSYFIGKGFANRTNYNRNSAALAIMLDLIRRQIKDTAYIFVDQTCQTWLGYRYLKEDLASMFSGKKIIALDCVGKGECIYTEQEFPWMMSEKSCLIFSGKKSKNDYVVDQTGKVDSEIDFEQMERIETMIMQMIQSN